MESSTLVVLPFAFLAFFVSSGESLRCVQCNSQTEPLCADPFRADSIPLMECTPDAIRTANTQLRDTSNFFKDLGHSLGFSTNDFPNLDNIIACKKIVITMGDKVQIVRSCSAGKTSSLDPCAAISKDLSSSTVAIACNLCDKDGCNGASGVAPKAIVLLVAVFISSLALFSRAH